MKNKKIIIVGAGPGGLTSGMILAHRGFDVTIFEKDAVVGGRNKQLELGSFKFDVGPTFLMLKFILEEMFEETGRKAEDYLEFKRLDPLYKLQFKDHTIYSSSDKKKMREEIARVFPGNENSFENFIKQESRRFESLYPCLQQDYSSLTSFFL
jgi:phytoene desaturase